MNTTEKVKNIICDLKHTQNIDDNFELIESGYLDSFGVMHLLTEVEKQFNISIPVESIIPENFSSAKKIAELIEKII